MRKNTISRRPGRKAPFSGSKPDEGWNNPGTGQINHTGNHEGGSPGNGPRARKKSRNEGEAGAAGKRLEKPEKQGKTEGKPMKRGRRGVDLRKAKRMKGKPAGSEKTENKRRRKYISVPVKEKLYVDYYMQSKADGKSIAELASEGLEWYARNYFPDI